MSSYITITSMKCSWVMHSRFQMFFFNLFGSTWKEGVSFLGCTTIVLILLLSLQEIKKELFIHKSMKRSAIFRYHLSRQCAKLHKLDCPVYPCFCYILQQHLTLWFLAHEFYNDTFFRFSRVGFVWIVLALN